MRDMKLSALIQALGWLAIRKGAMDVKDPSLFLFALGATHHVRATGWAYEKFG
jgi:hypothetical protein